MNSHFLSYILWGGFFFMNSIVREANYIINTNKTIREAAKDLGLSKSVLHRHMNEALKVFDYGLYLQIKKIFFEHNKNRHIRGGEATRKKYSLG